MKTNVTPHSLTLTLTVEFDESELAGIHSLDDEDRAAFCEQLSKELGEKTWVQLRRTLGIHE